LQLILINPKNKPLAKRSFHIPRFFWYAAGIAIIYFVLNQLNILPSIGNLFKSKQVTIDNTPVLVKEVKNIAQLMTMSSYDEVVVDTSKYSKPGFPVTLITNGTSSKTQLVIIAKGQIIAGIDLQELDESKIYLKKDSVSLILPRAKVLEAIVNPSQFEIFIEEKRWDPSEVSSLKIEARELMVHRATQQGLLIKATAKAKLIMESFLRSAGFKRISVQ
jgi:Protein of unknown function (DUF4230)